MSDAEKWDIFIIIAVIVAAVMIFNFRIKQENNRPIEYRIADWYCGKIASMDRGSMV